jgi:hypothetical protein
MSKNKSNQKIAPIENLTRSDGMMLCVLPSTTFIPTFVIADLNPRPRRPVLRSVHHTSRTTSLFDSL